MKKVLLLTVLIAAVFTVSLAQTSPESLVSEQIKNERDQMLTDLNHKLVENEQDIQQLTFELSKSNNLRNKVSDLNQLQNKLDERIRILEERPKAKTMLNGQLAFTELLSIQRELKPAVLFANSTVFFTKLGETSNLTKYPSFTSWKQEYTKWYTSRKNNDEIVDLINNSLTLISDASNKVPMYGSIINTVTSGISVIVMNLGKKNKALISKTPKMIRVLNAISQFENQKAIIDNEWETINKELGQLEKENEKLLNDQLAYYNIKYSSFKKNYYDETLDYKRDEFKNEARKIINQQLSIKDSSETKWIGHVQTYMYKVQSLRLRFGQLMNRVQTNINRYSVLIDVYSNTAKFPAEFTTQISSLGKSLDKVRSSFRTAFSPERYIEDSAVMYIERT